MIQSQRAIAKPRIIAPFNAPGKQYINMWQAETLGILAYL